MKATHVIALTVGTALTYESEEALREQGIEVEVRTPTPTPFGDFIIEERPEPDISYRMPRRNKKGKSLKDWQ